MHVKPASSHLSRHHFDEDAAQTPDVRRSSVTLPLRSGDDFRGHVRWGRKTR